MQTNDPKIEVEGPTATHDQSCAVRHGQPAVLDMNKWVFQPSWTAQDEGWRLVQARNWLQRAALKLLFAA